MAAIPLQPGAAPANAPVCPPLTPIRTLAELRSTAADWQEDIGNAGAGVVKPFDRRGWDNASCILSRQSDALRVAMLYEPPRTTGDAMSLLIAISEQVDGLGSAETATHSEIDLAHELITVTFDNLIAYLATVAAEPTELEAAAVRISQKLASERRPRAGREA